MLNPTMAGSLVVTNKKGVVVRRGFRAKAYSAVCSTRDGSRGKRYLYAEY